MGDGCRVHHSHSTFTHSIGDVAMSHVHMPIASKSLNLPHKHVVESAKHAHNQTCLRLSYDAKLTFVCTGISLALTTRMDGQAEGRKEGTPLARVRKLFLYVTPLRRDGILSLSVVIVVEGRREKGAHVDIGEEFA